MSLDTLVAALMQQRPFTHPTADTIDIVETHLSVLLLTGEYVYKFKKSLNLGFQDFTTLALRQTYCEKEVTFNQALTSDLYLSAVPIYGSITAPSFTPSGPPIEWAVLMKQFPPRHLFSDLIAAKKLTAPMILSLADRIAAFHLQRPAITDTTFTSAMAVHQPVLDNFPPLLSHLAGQPDAFDHLVLHQTRVQEMIQDIRPILDERGKAGWIRHCHGDLHCANIVSWHNEPVVFDCIEFNDTLYQIDVQADIAFLMMDLIHHQKPKLARLFLDRYLTLTGDYIGALLLPYYTSYRAMVRAKIATFTAMQQSDEALRAHHESEVIEYIALANQLSQPHPVSLSITFGLSGAGKSTYTQHLVEMQPNIIRLRSDVARKRLFGLHPLRPSNPADRSKLYAQKTTEALFDSLLNTARQLLEGGMSVVVDAAFLSARHRSQFKALADSLAIPFTILHFDAPIDVCAARIEERSTAQNEASDATVSVLHQQAKTMEPLTAAEKPFEQLCTHTVFLP